MSNDNTKQLNENDLEKVNGGSVDWQLFSNKLLDAIKNKETPILLEYRDILAAIKDRDYIRVGILALPLIAKDPVLMKIMMECTK